MADKFKDVTAWKANFLSENVQATKVKGGDFLSSESMILCSGPADYTDTDGSNLIPIGLVQNVQVSQQKAIQQLWEIGSRKSFFVPGRTQISAGISRILFDGPSLMYAMYIQKGTGDSGIALAGQKIAEIKTNGASGASSVQAVMADAPSAPYDNALLTNPIVHQENNDSKPGLFFVNLASSFFNAPAGLGFLLYDGERQTYGGFYLENVYVQTHSFSVASQQTILMENISLRASSVRAISSTSF